MSQIIKIKDIIGSDFAFEVYRDKIVQNIDFSDINELTLDFSGLTLITYPFTGQLLDTIFEQMKKTSTEKKLVIKLDAKYQFDELFVGSVFLNLTDVYRISNNEIVHIVKKKLKTFNISITIFMKEEKIEIK